MFCEKRNYKYLWMFPTAGNNTLVTLPFPPSLPPILMHSLKVMQILESIKVIKSSKIIEFPKVIFYYRSTNQRLKGSTFRFNQIEIRARERGRMFAYFLTIIDNVELDVEV